MSQSNVIRFPAASAPTGAAGQTDCTAHLPATGAVVSFSERTPAAAGQRANSSQVQDRSDSHVLSTSEVWEALSDNRLLVHYQPQYDMRTGKTVAAEALVRLVDTNGQLIYPDRFIDMVEQSDLVVLLGRSVIKQVCQDLATSRATGTDLQRVAINVSANQLNLDAKLPEFIDLILDRFDLLYSDLEFELTERQTLNPSSDGMKVLNRLADRGANIVIDDFGMGYSSVAYLTELPIRMFKLDRALVTRLPESKAMRAVVRNLLSLAADLGLEVVAEGIETAEQNAFLTSEGCQYAQGFGYARPMPISELQSFLQHHTDLAQHRLLGNR